MNLRSAGKRQRRPSGDEPASATPAGFDGDTDLQSLVEERVQEAVAIQLRPIKKALSDQQDAFDKKLSAQAKKHEAVVAVLKGDVQALRLSLTRLQQQNTAAGGQQANQQGLKQQVETLDKRSREQQLLLKGLPEGSGSSASAGTSMWGGVGLLGTVSAKLAAAGAKTADGTEVTVVSAKRIGKAGGVRPRPVLLSFSGDSQVHGAFKANKELRKEKCSLDNFLTYDQLQTRRQLRAAFQYLQGEGLQPYYRIDRLYYTCNGKVQQYRLGSNLPGVPPPPTNRSTQASTPAATAGNRRASPTAPRAVNVIVRPSNNKPGAGGSDARNTSAAPPGNQPTAMGQAARPVTQPTSYATATATTAPTAASMPTTASTPAAAPATARARPPTPTRSGSADPGERFFDATTDAESQQTMQE